jgi:hypothetical protein
MSLEWGEAPHRGVGFATDQDRREAWERNRDYLMERCGRNGFRPQAWWDYEAPRLGVRRPRNSEYSKAALWETGQLTLEEKATFEKFWRRQFDECNKPEWYGHCIGHAKKGDTFASWLRGEEGRRAHYKWAGIPRALLKRWTEQRAKTIRKLKSAET